MSDVAAHLAREAKGLHQGLKELLKTHHPWDKEVEFHRKSLRRQHLRLLLVEPYAKESKDAETHLWMQTSHQFISRYKQSLAALDCTLQSVPRPQQRQAGHGPVEYRKLMQRFRQFLSDEDKFWTQFVVRYQRAFALHEAYPALVALAILSPAATDDDADLPTLPDPGTTTSGGRNSASRQTHHGRSHPFFPPEDSTPAPDPAELASRLAILSKALVCLGDIARYRELYNESGGRPKAGHEDGTVPAKRGGRGGRSSGARGGGGIPGFEAIPRARNYDRAISCYEQARLLVPYEGNPSHQLAILAFYQGDMFGSLLHYYRALCVRQPYETASENVRKILSRALDQQARKLKEARPIAAATQEPAQVPPPRLRVDHLKENIVLLHALWRLGTDKVQMNPVAHADEVTKDFQSLVSERVLPIELVSKVVVLSQGALWNHRMIRDASSLPLLSDSSSSDNKRSSRRRIPDPPSLATESQILRHVIAIYRVLLEIGAAELAVPPPEDAAENDLAQRITAPFRRTLPALRIASKWLIANIHYVLHAAALPVNDGGYRHGSTGKGTRAVVIEQGGDWSLFWAKFVRFYSALGAVFPSERLPSLTTPLDEDVDLKGFLPLRDLLLVGGGGAGDVVPEGRRQQRGQNGNPSSDVREKVHPNEEQLMRIWDLLQDAKYFAELEACPIRLDDGNVFSFVDNGVISSIVASSFADVQHEPVRIQAADQINHNGVRQIEDDDDAMTEDTARTDDDPVRDAFERVLDDHGAMDNEDNEEGVEVVGEEDEEGDEVILYNPRPLGSPPTPGMPLTTLPAAPMLRSVPRGVEDDYPYASSVPMGATDVMSNPGRTRSLSNKSSMIVPRTTAQDLLNNVIGTKRGGTNGHGADVARPSPARPTTMSMSTPAPQFPFGLGPNAPPSIWSTSLDQESSSPPNMNAGSTTFGSPSLRHGWSSSQGGGSALGLGSSHSVAAASGLVGGHWETISSFGVPQQQFGRQSTLGSQWRVNSNRAAPHVESALVSGVAMSPSPGRLPSTAHLGNVPTSASSSPYQAFSNGLHQHLHHAAPVQHGTFWSAGGADLHHQKSPSTSRPWGSGIRG